MAADEPERRPAWWWLGPPATAGTRVVWTAPVETSVTTTGVSCSIILLPVGAAN